MNFKKYILFSLLGMTLFVPSICFAQNQEKFPFLAEIQNESINVRAGQNENFEKVGILSKGDQIVVVDRSFNWYKIKLPINSESYISAQYVNLIGDNVGEATADRVNIRAKPGTNYSIIGQLKKGEFVKVVEKYLPGQKGEGWFKIEPVDQGYGWIFHEFVKFKSDQVPPARIIPPPSRSVYAKKPQTPGQETVTTKEAPASGSEGIIKISGVIDSLGDKTFSQNIRHKMVVDGKTTYLLQGYRSILDGFVSQKVVIEGIIQPNAQAPQKILLVTKINLVL